MLPHEPPSRPDFSLRRSRRGPTAITAESSSASVKTLFSPLPPALAATPFSRPRCTLAGLVPLTAAVTFSRVARLDG